MNDSKLKSNIEIDIDQFNQIICFNKSMDDDEICSNIGLMLKEYVSYLFNKYGHDIKEEYAYWIHKASNTDELSSYIHKLEMVTIYNSELYHLLKNILAGYIKIGVPKLTSSDKCNLFFNERVLDPVMAAMYGHRRYLVGVCNGCTVHNYHQRYHYLRELKKFSDESTYAKELTAECRRFRFISAATCFIAELVLQNEALAKVAADIMDIGAIASILDENIINLSNILMDVHVGDDSSEVKHIPVVVTEDN